MTQSSKILAIGAAGRFAGLVVPELAKRGATVRAFVRRPKETEEARAHGAAEIAIGDLSDRSSLDAALVGIDSVFYIAPVFLQDEVEIGKQMVSAATAAGVRRLVFSSVFQPGLNALENHHAKGPVEEAIFTSGMEYTLLQPAMFFQNYGAQWQAIMKSEFLAEPYSAEMRFTRVDYRDVAEVAAMALTDDRLLYGTFQLCAEGNLNRHQVAALVSEAVNRPIKPASPEFDDWSRRAKVPDGQLVPLKAMFDWYDGHELLGNALALRTILNREPRTLLSYFQELATQSSPS